MRNKIKSLKKGDGTVVTSQGELESEANGFFQNLFMAQDGTTTGLVIEWVESKVDDAMNARLCAPISDDEIERALFMMHPDKSPGPDGFTAGQLARVDVYGCFYSCRQCWASKSRGQHKDYLDACSEGSFTSKEVEARWDLLDRIKENAEGWENNEGKESGYADKPPFKPFPPKEGNEEKEEKKKKKGTKKKKKKKKKENKKKEVTAYPRVNEITLGNRKYVAPNDYCDNESEYDDLPMPITYISNHDLNEHTTFDIANLWETNSENDDDNNCHSVSAIHASSHNDIESSKLGEEVFENPFATGHYVLNTSPSNNNDEKAQKPKCSEKSRKITEILFRGRLTEPRASQGEAQGPHHRPARRVVTPPYGVVASGLFRLRLFAYLSRRDLKLRHRLTKLQKDSRAPPHRETPIRGTEVSVPHPAGRGIGPGAISTAVFTAIFTAIATSMMRRE
ncbi:hypothetical protein QYE76_047421 [Lolium multiflorum]|uniref:Uncharacterized protein n=1 Tax=Lolium multiflorum TaxID=4521 RepID=A0AAD8TRU8_LOLMU|nr:hypothetical protein QYE76_047421 [Lolium multiflorum]